MPGATAGPPRGGGEQTPAGTTREGDRRDRARRHRTTGRHPHADGARRPGVRTLMTIFLSYARDDEDLVKTMARVFEAARREVWFDHDLQGGDVWWPTILDHIRSDRKSTRLNSSHANISYAVFCL